MWVKRRERKEKSRRQIPFFFFNGHSTRGKVQVHTQGAFEFLPNWRMSHDHGVISMEHTQT